MELLQQVEQTKIAWVVANQLIQTIRQVRHPAVHKQLLFLVRQTPQLSFLPARTLTTIIAVVAEMSLTHRHKCNRNAVVVKS